jgi:hypothetical protein
MVDRLVFGWVVFVIPAIVLATIFRWLSVEFALGFVWITAFLTIVIGLLKYWQEPETYNGRQNG